MRLRILCVEMMLCVVCIYGNELISLSHFVIHSELNGRLCLQNDREFWTLNTLDMITCLGMCTLHAGCISVFYNGGLKQCEGCRFQYENSTGLPESKGTIYMRLTGPRKTFNNHWYTFPISTMTFYEAIIYCEADGGYVLQVDSDEENQFIVDNMGDITEILLGFTDEDVEGSWEWLKADIATEYTHWKPKSDPAIESNHRSDENCAAIVANGGYMWGDKDCNRRYHVICEYHQ